VEKELRSFQMGLYMMDFGIRVCLTGKDGVSTLMDQNIRECGKKGSRMEKGLSDLWMKVCMKECGKMESVMDLEQRLLKMELYIKVHGMKVDLK